MLPAWLPRVKDLKAVSSKPKQNNAVDLLNLPPSLNAEKSVDTDAYMCFVKALNLPRGTAKTCCMPFEGGLGYLSSSLDTDSVLSSHDVGADMFARPLDSLSSRDADYVAAAKLHSYGYDELFNGAEVPLHHINCKVSAWAQGTELDSHIIEGKKRMAVSCTQNDLYGVIENDTESSNVITPNTVESSFGSESSSANSSMVQKCRYSEDQRRQVMLWQEGDCPRSPKGGLEESVYPEEAPFFTRWQNISSSEDFSNACGDEMQDISRLSYCESAPNACKLVARSSRNLTSARRTGMEAMSRLTYNGRELNQQKSSSDSVSRNNSLSGFQRCHTRTDYASQVLPGCAFTMGSECSPSPAKSFIKLKSVQENTIESCSSSNLGLINEVSQKERGVCRDHCGKEASGASDSPNFCIERSCFEDSMPCGSTCSEWEETSALIALENPGLMLSSKWHKSSYGRQNPALDMRAEANQMCAGQDMRNSTSICASQDGLSMCAQQHDTDGEHKDGSPTSSQQDDGQCHKSLHDAYLRRGRRCRGSSFSAALPEGIQGSVGDSIALVKMSHDPYEDFRLSMYEMIMEKDLEEAMDVEELLYCYLSLNSPEHHELIEEVFSDVWSSILMSVR